MDGGSALAIDPLAVDGVEGPGAVVFEAPGRADAGCGNGDGVEGFDGVESDVGKNRTGKGGHGKSLTQSRWEVLNRKFWMNFSNTTLNRERDDALRFARGGSRLRRVARAAKWFAREETDVPTKERKD